MTFTTYKPPVYNDIPEKTLYYVDKYKLYNGASVIKEIVVDGISEDGKRLRLKSSRPLYGKTRLKDKYVWDTWTVNTLNEAVDIVVKALEYDKRKAQERLDKVQGKIDRCQSLLK